MKNTEKEIQMGNRTEPWKNGIAKSITLSVTEDCNLECKYCYMVGKNKKNKMTFEIAKKAIDYILTNKENFHEEAVIWEFVGGEPFLEIELIDKICDYIKLQMYVNDHPWFDNYMFSFSTNGLLYDTLKVQDFIQKNKFNISIGISVDGNKIKHDLQRVKPDGSGSYDDVMKNVPLWLEQFPVASTKATFSKDDLSYLKDSVLSLWENGIKNVSANLVFEDIWDDKDALIYEEQLKELGDYILKYNLFEEHNVRFFDYTTGSPLVPGLLDCNYCGSGKMLAIDYKGDFYPCIRFLDLSLNNRKGRRIGNVDEGINLDKLRPFQCLTLKNQSTKECIECEVATGCSWCTGYNFDDADTDTIFQRSTSLCEMHKANVRANKYFWEKYSEITGKVSKRKEYVESLKGFLPNEKYMQFIISDNITPHCSYRNWKTTDFIMNDTILEKGLKFCKNNNFEPIFLDNINKINDDKVTIISDSSNNTESKDIIVYDNEVLSNADSINNTILLVSKDNIDKIYSFVSSGYTKVKRINIVLEDIENWNIKDIDKYTEQINQLKEIIILSFKNTKPLELNVLTDRLNLDSMCNCESGVSTLALAPNGKIYLCPAFYFDDENSNIGDLDNGINVLNPQLLELESSMVCMECDSYHCKRCKFLNKKLTGEINTPSKIQCVISHIERNASKELQETLIKEGFILSQNLIPEVDYLDPFEKIINKH